MQMMIQYSRIIAGEESKMTKVMRTNNVFCECEREDMHTNAPKETWKIHDKPLDVLKQLE